MAVSSSSSSLTENFSNPFFLNNGDNPGAMLVSQPLTGSNYNTWSRSMIVSLITKNKMAFIEGSLPKLSPEDEAMCHAWTRCNNMIIAWFLDSVSKEIASSVIYITNCAEFSNFKSFLQPYLRTTCLLVIISPKSGLFGMN
jgi:hypothetical protein